MIGFDQPWWLLGVAPAVFAVVVLARRGRPPVARSQHRIAVGARSMAVGLLLAAVAQPLLLLNDSSHSVVFLVDRSESISAAAMRAQDEYIANAMAVAEPGDRAAIAVFASDLRVDASLSQSFTAAPIRAVVDGSRTDLAGALQASAALLPTSGSRRIVVLTDGVVTSGDPRPVAQELGGRGIVVDVVSFQTGRGPDALVESVRLPGVVRQGERATAEITVRSNVAGRAVLEVRLGDETELVETDLNVGLTTVEVDTTVAGQGFLNVIAEVQAPFDEQPANNRAQGVSRIIGPPAVAVVEGVDGEADQLVAALTAAGMSVDETASIPSDSELLSYDALMLVNMPLPPPDETESVRAFVEDLGRGLVVIGGDQSYGLGGYEDSELESILPVRSNPDDLVRRQPVAEVLVIDTSGSMADCHCDDGDFREGIGINKTDISRAGAALAIDALTSQDRVGVVSFGAATDWVLPLGAVPSPADAEAALGQLNPVGETTAIARGLEAALDALDGAEEPLRHIVLFTDGWDPNEVELLPAARAVAEAGITLSVLGTGEGPGITLQRMAEIGGGRYYAGENLEEIPEIFVEETLQVARGLAQEGLFFPVLAAPSPVTEDLTESPPLGGYVLTKEKPTARVPMVIGDQDPLLATWQRGLGRVSAWTADATARWSADWIVWQGFVQFWGSVVEEVLPPGRDRPPTVEVRGADLAVTFVAPDAPPSATAVATVRSPDGQTTTLPLTRGSDGAFSGVARAGVLGAYWVAVDVSDGGESIASGSSGAVSAYSDEFAFRAADPSLVGDVASMGGGAVDLPAESAFAAVPTLGRKSTPIWPWLAGLAVMLFVADVILRRLVLFTDAVRESDTPEEPGRPGRRRAEFVVPEAAPPDQPASETLGRLLDRRRRS